MMIINPAAKPITKEQFYNILFGDNANEILRKEKMKEFYDKQHHQNNIELIKGKIWYTGSIVFHDYQHSDFKVKQALDILRI